VQSIAAGSVFFQPAFIFNNYIFINELLLDLRWDSGNSTASLDFTSDYSRLFFKLLLKKITNVFKDLYILTYI